MRKVAIIGATGKVAQHAVRKALDAGFVVHALARHPENIEAQHDNLKTFQGDVKDPKSLEAAIEGVEMVLSCIGNRSKDKGVVIAEGTRHIIDVMKAKGVSRLALISSVGVGDSVKQLSALGFRGWIFGAMFFTMMNEQRKDLNAAEEAALGSGLDAVVVRPVELTKAPGKGTWMATDNRGKPGPKIAREDVAHFMVSLLDDHSFDGKAVSLGSVR